MPEPRPADSPVGAPRHLVNLFAEWLDGIEGGQHLDEEDREALADFLTAKLAEAQEEKSK